LLLGIGLFTIAIRNSLVLITIGNRFGLDRYWE